MKNFEKILIILETWRHFGASEAFGKNEHIRKILGGLRGYGEMVLAQVVDQATAEQVIRIITGVP